MMKISNVSMSSTEKTNTAKMTAATSEAKNLEKELTNKQQRLSSLSSTSDMSAREKQQERLKIEREIAELNRKLRLERLEEEQKAKEEEKAQEKKQIIKEEMFAQNTLSKKQGSLEKEQELRSKKATPAEQDDAEKSMITLKNMLVATTTVNPMEMTERSSRQLEGRANVLSAEIASDTILGTDTSAKKEALSQLQNKEEHAVELLQAKEKDKTPKEKVTAKIIIRE